MSLAVVGSLALDTVVTPFGERQAILGGAASFFAVGASHFVPVSMIGVVGDDFPEEHLQLFAGKGIDVSGVERRSGGKTFRWTGRYAGRMDTAETVATELNVLACFRPTLQAEARRARYVFLANTDPVTQIHVREQLECPTFVLLDTMNFWIQGSSAELRRAVAMVDGVILNDEEARDLAGQPNLIRAVAGIAGLGVRTIVVKKGEHGSLLFHDGQLFALPAYPLERVVDPTGAGDSFAAGFLGALAEKGDLGFPAMKRALAYGTTVASFTVEGFGLEGLLSVDRAALDRRHSALLAFVRI
jgi:sugar/nucleoside kinase (ribokinase family)